MISKFRANKTIWSPNNAALYLAEIGFSDFEQIRLRPEMTIWKAIRKQRPVYLKCSLANSEEAKDLILEQSIHRFFHPFLEVTITEIKNFICLVTPALERPHLVTLQDLIHSLKRYKKVSHFVNELSTRSRNFTVLIEKAQEALAYFQQANLITDQWADALYDSISLVAKYYYDSDKTFCHGDVNFQNLYLFENSFLFLDWEDCLLSFNGFDEIYYLTFLSNRHLLNINTFREIGLEWPIARATYFIIVLLKEYFHVTRLATNRQLTLIDRLEFLNELSA